MRRSEHLQVQTNRNTMAYFMGRELHNTCSAEFRDCIIGLDTVTMGLSCDACTGLISWSSMYDKSRICYNCISMVNIGWDDAKLLTDRHFFDRAVLIKYIMIYRDIANVISGVFANIYFKPVIKSA